MNKKNKIVLILLLIIATMVGLFLLQTNVRQRELILTDFKNEQEYQFGEVSWNSNVSEVENLLDCTLKQVPNGDPNYKYYGISDVIFVLNGYEAKTSVEFRMGELVYIDFAFKELENPQALFDEIISVWQEQYGPETTINASENIGKISYHWRTEKTQLSVAFSKDIDEVRIFLASLV